MKKLLIASCISLASLPLWAENATNSSQELSIPEQVLSQETCIPALNVKIVPLINKELSIPFKHFDVSYIYKVETAKTNLPWLNKLLLKELISHIDNSTHDIKSEKELINYYKENHQKELKELTTFIDEEGIGTAEEYSSSITFLSQRLNIASFQRNTFIYHNGGAHGIGFVTILNFDLNQKNIINYPDLLLPNKKQALFDLLWENYNSDVMRDDPFIEKNQFYISPNFLFDIDGMTFIYQPYEIGPYSMGNIELKLSWNQLKEIIKPEYQW